MTILEQPDPPTPPVDVDLVLRQAVTTAMNSIGEHLGCRPMHWSIRDRYTATTVALSGFPSQDTYGEAGPAVAAQWAAAFHLTQDPDEPSYRSWTGLLDRYRVEIWCHTEPHDAGTTSGGVR